MIKFADERTADVLSNKTFDQLLIHPEVINRIKKCNYQLPTPVQAGAIPLGLLGNDLLVQAKSGTGKTLVFATLVANAVMETRGTDVVAVIIAPVREIAYQIKDLIDQLTPSETRTCVFIGGEDVKDNKAEIAHGCSVAIGTPGRMGQLIRDGSLSFKQSKLFVLDEADKLMESTFTEDIKLIYNALNPETTQVTAFSATYPNDFDKYLSGFMKSPISFRIDSQDVQLLGIYQYAVVGLALRPVDIINKLLEEISYAQSVIFTNQSDKCVQVSDYLSEKRFKVAAISGNFTQEERKKVITDLKNFALRIMVSTDLTARGIDAPNVNLVFNVGVPATLETYLHRIGRAGRYGGNGASITLLTTQQDVANFVRMTAAGGLNVKYLDISTDIPYDLTYNGNFYSESFGFIDSCNKVVADVKADVARISEEREPSKVGLTEYSNNSLLKIRTNSVDEMQSFKAIVNNCENNDVIASPSPVNAVSQSNSLSVAPNGEIVPTPQLSANNVEQINPETNAVVEAQSSNSEVFAESPKESTSSNSFVIPARPDPWAEDHPRPRLSTDTATPLPIVNANIVRQIIPDFTQDLEADIAKAKEAAADVPPIPNVPVFPQPPRRGGYNQTGTGQETNGFNSSRGNSRGAPFGSSQGFASQDNSGFGSQRGNSFGGGRGGRGGFNQSSSGDGQDTSGFGSNRGRGGRRGGFGGDFAGNNQDSSGFGSSSRGSFGGGGRGGFNQSSFGDGQDNSGGFGSSARGSFGTSGRGGFNQSSSTDGQGFTSNRGGRGARGAFSSFGDGQDNSGYGSGRGDGSFGGRGSRGGFGTSGRGGFNQSSSAEGQDASGFGSQRGRGGRGGFSQSSFGDAQDNSGGFGSSARGGRGAFSGNIDNSGGFGSSARGGRGAFSGNTQESSAFPSRGGFGQNDGNQEANENVLVPGRRFVR
uniref:ATP-dependent RNA helicase n=1 Tax=Panagrolaimus sp. ES5 TaxID=591445 RepID=A0AC34FKZ6_9BILA